MFHFRSSAPFNRAPISACDYYDSMITRISNIDLSLQPSRHFARALARNNIVPPSDRQIKFVDVLRFDLPLSQNRRWIRFLPLACLCYIVPGICSVRSDKRVTGDGKRRKVEKPEKNIFLWIGDTSIPKGMFRFNDFVNRIRGFDFDPFIHQSSLYLSLSLSLFFVFSRSFPLLFFFFLHCAANRGRHKPRPIVAVSLLATLEC